MALEFTDTEFERILERAQMYYRTIDRIHCPYFGGKVEFDQEGFQHLRRKSWNRGRRRNDQFMRLKHISIAPRILTLSNTLQGIWHGHDRVRRHRHGRWEEAFVPTIFYEFIAVIENRRFKVIVKEPEGKGRRIFWSLIPFWQPTERGSRIMHEGDPAKD